MGARPCRSRGGYRGGSDGLSTVRVELSKLAQRDIATRIDYLIEHHPESAVAFLATMDRVFALLTRRGRRSRGVEIVVPATSSSQVSATPPRQALPGSLDEHDLASMFRTPGGLW